ncbi:MAG: hypothetical protein COT74_11085 [Bdellovibrionales bacterium CG10_big_fil_rev_8_21_14_0_10_45_34]|nr:MAG: hypothetical protein COT74_11085 [Bdellovibrionales bacterium CG10_big_fil_rev_8_21_14_0_10_45_34]
MNKKYLAALLLIFLAVGLGFGLYREVYQRRSWVSEVSLRDIKGFRAIKGMTIDSASLVKDELTVATTGSKFIFKQDGTLEFWQRIPAERKVTTLKLEDGIWPRSISKKDDFSIQIETDPFSISLQGDSLAIISFKKMATTTFLGHFQPEFTTGNGGKQNFIDTTGGFGYYPVQDKPLDVRTISDELFHFATSFSMGDELWVSVFPPRPYDWARLNSPLAHTGKEEEPYSPETLIKEAAKHAKVFTLHSFFMPGGDKEPWLISSFTPSDMKEFERVRDSVQAAGMKFLIYASPYYSRAPDFFAEMRKLIHDYKIDGLYYDGISYDFRESYKIVRKTRELFGDDIIVYIHASTDPFNSTTFFAPVIDTYADYILRGEASRPANLSLDNFLKYVVSGLHTSGVNGYWLYYGSANADQKGEIFNLPDDAAIETAFRNHVYFPWSDTMYRSASKKDWQDFTKKYFKRLEKYKEGPLSQ